MSRPTGSTCSARSHLLRSHERVARSCGGVGSERHPVWHRSTLLAGGDSPPAINRTKRLAHDPVQVPAVGYTLQFVLARVFEGETGAADQVRRGAAAPRRRLAGAGQGATILSNPALLGCRADRLLKE